MTADVKILGGQTAAVDGYINCRCGAHWWHLTECRWYRLTSCGSIPHDGEAIGCMRAKVPTEKATP